MKMFEKVRGAVGKDVRIIDRILDDPDANISLEAVLKFSIGLDYKRVDYRHPIPISKQMIYFSYNDIREYNQSSYKRTYLSEKHDLDTNGYLDWVVKRVEEWGMYMWYLVFYLKETFFQKSLGPKTTSVLTLPFRTRILVENILAMSQRTTLN